MASEAVVAEAFQAVGPAGVGKKNMSKNKLSPQNLENLKAAVAKAEKNTLGEIVPFIAKESDSYPDAEWRLAVLCSFSVSFSLYLFMEKLDPIFYLYAQLPAIFCGLLLARIEFLKRLFIKSGKMDEEVFERACQVFLDQNVHRTAEHSGLLIYISLFEHQALILADQGINDKVTKGTWDEVLKKLLSEIKAGRLAEGLESAIQECGSILSTHFPASKSHKNELGDDIRQS